MYMFPLFLLILFIMARTISTYHPHLLFKGYFIIKNKFICRTLIDQADPATGRAKNAKPNRNKLTYAGTVFYIFLLLLVCFTIVMLLLPPLPCEQFVYESKALYLAGSTLNEKLPTVFAFTLLFAGFGFHFLNTSQYAVEKTSAKKFVRCLYYAFAAIGAVGTMGGLWIAATTIIEVIQKA